MGDSKPLRITGAFGPSRDQALLLAAHPDEEHTPGGAIVPKRRTLVLSLAGSTATFVEERPQPLVRAWYSRGSGVAYCSSVASNKLHLLRAGKWSEEVFSPTPVDVVMFLFGIDGPTPEEDQVFLSTPRGLYARVGNKWTHHPLGGSGHANQIHGRKPSEVFIGGPTLWKWDGQTATELEPPDDDTATAVWVTADDRLIAGNTHLSITNAAGEWERIDTPTQHFGGLDELDGIIYAASREGVMQVMLDGGSALVSPRARTRRFVNLGDALIAISNEACLVGKGLLWQAVQVPSCEVGKRP